jgi:acyl-CoA thioesterase II
VVYQVDRVRDGGSFSTRRVVAVQKGKPIFFCSASFQYDEEGFQHQTGMPDVPGPEGLKSETELARLIADSLPEGLRERAVIDKPIEIRPVTVGLDRLAGRRDALTEHLAAEQLTEPQILTDASKEVLFDGLQAQQGDQLVQYLTHACSPMTAPVGGKRNSE